MTDTLIQRLARSQVEMKTGKPAPETVGRNEIQPFQPGVAADFLKTILDAEDKISERSRMGKKGYTHISTLTSGVCPRAHVLAVLNDKVEFNAVTGGHRLVWAYGRAAEKHIRDQLTQSGTRHRFQIYGKWKCVCEATEHVGTRPADMACGTCKKPVDQYHEQPFWDREYNVVGNPDMSLLISKFMMIVEIKSMNAKEWEALSAPKTEHINQALMYRWLAKRNGFTVHDNITFVYTSKEFKWGSPYKQFLFAANTPAADKIVERTLEAAKLIADGLKTQKPPPRLIACTSPTAKSAKACTQCATCFNLKD